MFAHEEGDEVGVFFREPEAAAEELRLLRPDDLVAASEALPDIVKEPGNEEPPRVGKRRHELRAERVLVGVLGAPEAAEVLDDEDRVLVDREDVVEVVLHLADYMPEGREHAGENSPGIHHGERIVGAFFKLDDVEKGLLVFRILAVGNADLRGCVPESAQEPRRKTGKFGVKRKDEEGSENRLRVPFVDVVPGNVHFVAEREKVGAEAHGRGEGRAADETVRDRLELDDRHLHDRLRIPVVALHEGFGRPHEARRLVAEPGGKRFLNVEEKPVLVAVREEMELDPELREKAEALFGRL